MRVNSELLTVSALLLLSACVSPRQQITRAAIDWPTKVEQVAIGMTRAEVNHILPAWGGPAGALLRAPRITTVTGAGSGHVYWVAQDWRVTITYDHTGGIGSEQNRVKKPITIEKVRL